MKPRDFYFQLCQGDDFPGHYFMITPKDYFDSEGALSDESGIADDVVPEGFGELSESTYEYDGDPLEGRRNLLALGFTEIDFGFPGCDAYPGASADGGKSLAGSLSWLGHPKGPYSTHSIEDLTDMLMSAVEDERFEKAAELRDEINSRK
jgi:hypothetical protein